MDLHFDTHELVGLVKSFEDASGGPMVKDVEKVVFMGAMNIKRDAARRISGHPHFRGVPGSIDFDMYRSLRSPAAEIGPNHAKPQGNIAHIAENGSPTSAPMPFMTPAGEAEEPKFAKALEGLAAKALG